MSRLYDLITSPLGTGAADMDAWLQDNERLMQMYLDGTKCQTMDKNQFQDLVMVLLTASRLYGTDRWINRIDAVGTFMFEYAVFRNSLARIDQFTKSASDAPPPHFKALYGLLDIYIDMWNRIFKLKPPIPQETLDALKRDETNPFYPRYVWFAEQNGGHLYIPTWRQFSEWGEQTKLPAVVRDWIHQIVHMTTMACKVDSANSYLFNAVRHMSVMLIDPHVNHFFAFMRSFMDHMADAMFKLLLYAYAQPDGQYLDDFTSVNGCTPMVFATRISSRIQGAIQDFIRSRWPDDDGSVTFKYFDVSCPLREMPFIINHVYLEGLATECLAMLAPPSASSDMLNMSRLLMDTKTTTRLQDSLFTKLLFAPQTGVIAEMLSLSMIQPSCVPFSAYGSSHIVARTWIMLYLRVRWHLFGGSTKNCAMAAMKGITENLRKYIVDDLVTHVANDLDAEYVPLLDNPTIREAEKAHREKLEEGLVKLFQQMDVAADDRKLPPPPTTTTSAKTTTPDDGQQRPRRWDDDYDPLSYSQADVPSQTEFKDAIQRSVCIPGDYVAEKGSKKCYREYQTLFFMADRFTTYINMALARQADHEITSKDVRLFLTQGKDPDDTLRRHRLLGDIVYLVFTCIRLCSGHMLAVTNKGHHLAMSRTYRKITGHEPPSYDADEGAQVVDYSEVLGAGHYLLVIPNEQTQLRPKKSIPTADAPKLEWTDIAKDPAKYDYHDLLDAVQRKRGMDDSAWARFLLADTSLFEQTEDGNDEMKVMKEVLRKRYKDVYARVVLTGKPRMLLYRAVYEMAVVAYQGYFDDTREEFRPCDAR